MAIGSMNADGRDHQHLRAVEHAAFVAGPPFAPGDGAALRPSHPRCGRKATAAIYT
jgi:hypothetical protein